MVQNDLRGLGRRSGFRGNIGDAISATRSSKMLAVAQNHFAFVQGHFFLCPIDFSPQTVGDVGPSVMRKTNHARAANCKLRIVGSNERLTLGRFTKFAAAVRTTGNNRVGIDGTVRVKH